MVYTRGLKEANLRLGNLELTISNLLKKKEVIKIFESGCGYGKVMVQLKKKFGDKINLIGMNNHPNHGDQKKMISFALEEGIITTNEIKLIESIQIIYGDAGKSLPFENNSIDLVYSQASSYLYNDKIHFLENVAKILSKDGIAKITSFEENIRLPIELRQLLKIYDKGYLISFDKIIEPFNNVQKIKLYDQRYIIEIRSGDLNFGLTLEYVINVNNFGENLHGIISIYSKK